MRSPVAPGLRFVVVPTESGEKGSGSPRGKSDLGGISPGFRGAGRRRGVPRRSGGSEIVAAVSSYVT